MRRSTLVSCLLLAGIAPTAGAQADPARPTHWQAPVRTGQADEVRLTPGGQAWLPGAFQELRLVFRMRCGETCPAGVLLGASPADQPGSAYLLSFQAADAGRAYRVQFAADGAISDPQPLVLAPSPLAARMPNFVRGEPNNAAPPAMTIAAGAEHEVEILLHDGVLGGKVGGRPIRGFEIPGEALFGRVAVLGPQTGEAVVSEPRVQDFLQGGALLPLRTDPGFEVRQLSDLFFSEGAAAGDLNRDGHTDIVAGPFIYFGPDFGRTQRVYRQRATAPNWYVANSMLQYVVDPDHDGWGDILQIALSPPVATLYRNPHGRSRTWQATQVLPSVTSEATALVDLLGDGRPALVMMRGTGAAAEIGYARPDETAPFGAWVFTPVSRSGAWGAHGIGAGDVNGDGRLDILQARGWFEQPAAPGQAWTHHPQEFGEGAEMFAYDVDGDGLNDVVTTLQAHGRGIAWFRQVRSGREIRFERREILSTDWREPHAFSQPHALAIADFDGDGLTDLVSGKRWWGHLDTDIDPDAEGPATLYRFSLRRDGEVRFEPTLLHNNAPVGVQLVAADVTGDGRPDIVVSARKGTFLFINRGAPPAPRSGQ